jgi:DNA-binding NtrC family response regulator
MGNSNRPDAFVIEDATSIRVAVSRALEDLGLAVAGFDNAKQALAAFDQHPPKIIFLDIVLKESDATDVIKGLNERHYSGTVQLFSGQPRLIDAIQRVAVRYGLTTRPPLTKPLQRGVIAKIIAETGLRGSSRAAH